MKTPKGTPRNIVLDDESIKKLDAIRAKLGKGRSVSRSAAIRTLIRRFSLPGWTVERSKTDQPTKAAA